MKTVDRIRDALSNVSGALREFPPEVAPSGNEEARKVRLYDPGVEDYLNDARTLAPGRGLLDGSSEFDSYIFELGADLDEREVHRAMGSGAGREIERATQINGIDALGYYMTFHQAGLQWGIHLKVSGLYFLCDLLKPLDVPFVTRLYMAARLIHTHELFHFCVDYATAQFECLWEQPFFWPAKEKLRDPELQYNVQEEQLATAFMIREAGPRRLRKRGRADVLREWISRRPRGYGDAFSISSWEKFEAARERYLRRLIDQVEGGAPRLSPFCDVEKLLPDTKSVWPYCPVFLVRDEDLFRLPHLHLEYFRSVQISRETDHFNRRLARLPFPIVKKWQGLKRKLVNGQLDAKGVNFKPWRRPQEKNLYSARVDKQYRAHMRYHSDDALWTAEDIGTHKELGHG